MKKILFLVLLGSMLTGVVNAQNFYTRIGIGLSGGTSSNLDMLYKYTNTGTKQTVEVVPVDLGSGFTGTVAFGYMVKKYLGFELSISEFIGFPNIGDSIMKFPGGTDVTARVTGNMLCVTPSIVITAGLEKVNPYARFGIVIGVLPSMYERLEATQATNPVTDIVMIRRFYGGAALGYSAALGVDFNLNKVVSLFVEATFQGLTWSPFYSEINKYTVDGNDHLGELTTFQKKTEYYSKLETNDYVSPDVPKKELRKTYPFDNAGVSFGVRFKF
ncbi:MAG: outer membrane beta-barrel protein [Bacteroidota bacterium]